MILRKLSITWLSSISQCYFIKRGLEKVVMVEQQIQLRTLLGGYTCAVFKTIS